MSKYFDIQYAYGSTQGLFRPNENQLLEFSKATSGGLSEGQILTYCGRCASFSWLHIFRI
jgi:hypothetical protein